MKALLYKLGSRAVISIATVLLVFSPFASLTAQAQSNPIQTPQAGTLGSFNIAAANATANNTSTTNTTTGVNSVDVFGNCNLLGKGSVSACVSSIIYALTIGIGSVFAYVAAYFFDITIQLSLNGASYGLDFISTSWTTARDLANMAFLFILLYIAFTIIFRAETGGTMSMLAGVIVVALLVNFSFFFTRVVIDAGNILSLQFYNSIPAPSIAQTIQGSPVASTVINNSTAPSLTASAGTAKDLTASIMNMLNVQGLLNNNSFSATGTNFVATIFIYIAGAIILWILTVAFVTNGVKFLFRVVVLWFLIVASPIAFVGAAAQGVNGRIFKQWRELLVNHAFFPVVFMFVFLILNNFAVTMSSANGLVGGVFTTLQSTGSNSSWSAIGAALVSIAIRLVLVVAVIYVAMRASDGMKVYGAKAAEKAGNWAGSKFINTFGSMGRNTFGIAGYKLAQNSTLQQWAARDSVIGRNLWRGANRLGGASFDARAPLKAAGAKDVYGLNLKGANKGGYKGRFDARVKEREAEAKKFSDKLTDEQKKVIEDNVKAAAAPDIEKLRIPESAAKTLQSEAQKQYDDAEKEQKRLEREVQKAQDEIEHLKNMKREGTPEMDNVSSALKEAKERLNTQRDEVATRKADLDESRKNTQVFSSKIEDLNKKIQKDTKDEQTKAIPKNLYADSIAGKGPLGRLGNMSRLGTWIPAADKAAADKIKKGKSKEQKAAEALKELNDDGEKKEEGGGEDKKDEGH